MVDTITTKTTNGGHGRDSKECIAEQMICSLLYGLLFFLLTRQSLSIGLNFGVEGDTFNPQNQGWIC